MLVAEVIPLKTTKKLGILSYYTTLNIELGDLVEINIQKRSLKGIIIGIQNLKDAKLNIKSNDFTIRKIKSIIKKSAIDKNILYGLQYIASLHCTNTSHLITSLIPEIFLENINYKFNSQKIDSETKTNGAHISIKSEYKNTRPECIYADNAEILTDIKSLIRETFADKKSVAIISPTILQVKNLFEHLSESIEDRSVFYHSELTEKKAERVFKDLTENDRHKLIVQTPSLVFLVDKNIGAVVISDEISKYYISSFNGIDIRNVIAKLCELLNIKVFYTGSIPNIDTYKNIKDRKIDIRYSHLNYKTLENIHIIHMNQKDENDKPIQNRSIYISNELKSYLDYYVKNNTGKIVLYTQRKGSHTSSVCRDCGEVKKCKTCQRSLVLKKGSAISNNRDRKANQNEIIYYTCINCKFREMVEISDDINKQVLCENCGSYRMEILGIGTDGIYEYLQSTYPELNIFRIDSDKVKTRAQAIKTYRDFERCSEESISVLIGTEMILPLINNIDLIAIISVDSLFSIPEYNVDINLYSTIFKLHDSLFVSRKNKSKLFLQTRTKENVLEYLDKKNVVDFYDYELETRKNLKLPPYSIMLSFDIPFNEVNDYRDITPKFLQEFANYSISINTKNGKVRRVIIIIPEIEWQEREGIREMCINNLINYNLQINPQSIFS